MTFSKLQRVLIFLILFGFTFFPIFIQESSEDFFDHRSVENVKLPFFCGLQLEDGYFKTDNLKTYCQDEEIEDSSVELFLLKSSVEENLGVGFLKIIINGEDQYRVFAIEKEKGFVAEKEAEKGLYSIRLEDGGVVLNNSVYRIIDDRFEEVTDEKKDLLFSADQFRLQIPRNWEVKRSEEGYFFYNREAEPKTGVFLSLSEFGNFKLKREDYRKEYEEIKDSFSPFSIKEMSDYRFFADRVSNYLEVNTVTEKINYFQGGEKKESFNILASGNPNNWNATPSGMYRIISKEGLRFSTESSVYMPFSMRIYGKYLIHGEAYYPSGAPYVSELSGGCVRVRNEEMVNLYEIVEADLPVVVVTHEKKGFLREQNRFESLSVELESFLVVDVDSGHVLFEKNAKEKRKINAVNGMMTSLAAIENMGVDRRITVRNYMLNPEEEEGLIRQGRSFRLIDLVAPALIENSDPVIRVLSHYLGRDNTLSLMNEKTKSIGMEETEISFSSETGYRAVSTVADLYYLAYYLRNSRKPLLDISRGVWVPNMNYTTFPGLQNRNIFYGEGDFLGGQIDFGEGDGYSGFFLFNLQMGEEREVLISFSGATSREKAGEEVVKIKKWLEEAFN